LLRTRTGSFGSSVPKRSSWRTSTEDGLTKLTWADSLGLDKWLDEYTLDEVWEMGRLGRAGVKIVTDR
jgi:hypothetical protein